MTAGPIEGAANVTYQPRIFEIGSPDLEAELERLSEAYKALALSIGTSNQNSSWTGWNWRENDPA